MIDSHSWSDGVWEIHAKRYMQLDTIFSRYPSIGYAALDRTNRSNPDTATWITCLAFKIDRLEKGFYPTGPGYPYVVQIAFHWENRAGGLQGHQFTLDPTTGRVYPCAVLWEKPHRVRGRVVHGQGRIGIPEGWTKPLGKDDLSLCQVLSFCMNITGTVDWSATAYTKGGDNLPPDWGKDSDTDVDESFISDEEIGKPHYYVRAKP